MSLIVKTKSGNYSLYVTIMGCRCHIGVYSSFEEAQKASGAFK